MNARASIRRQRWLFAGGSLRNLWLREIGVSRLNDVTSCIRIGGEWRMDDGLPAEEKIETDIAAAATRPRMVFDTGTLQDWDSSLVVFVLAFIAAARQRGVTVDSSGLPEGLRRLVALAEAVPESPGQGGPRRPWLASVGIAWGGIGQSLARSLSFLGNATHAFGRLWVGRARHRRADLYEEIVKAGARALPIVSLIGFLLGMIMAFVGGTILRTYGATVQVADIVAIAMVRELGAIMTAIIMAGRTGSAYAAELGSMRVSQEIDALVTMGVPPIDFLVLNRLLALSLMLPVLAVYADFVGIFGGGLVATRMLGLTATQYAEEIKQAIPLTTFAIGEAKSVVFGIIVAICGCSAGLRAGRSAAAVGAAATRAVVHAIVWIIVLDGVFAVVLYILGV